jgi:hypothetical protein
MLLLKVLGPATQPESKFKVGEGTFGQLEQLHEGDRVNIFCLMDCQQQMEGEVFKRRGLK